MANDFYDVEISKVTGYAEKKVDKVLRSLVESLFVDQPEEPVQYMIDWLLDYQEKVNLFFTTVRIFGGGFHFVFFVRSFAFFHIFIPFFCENFHFRCCCCLFCFGCLVMVAIVAPKTLILVQHNFDLTRTPTNFLTDNKTQWTF